MASAKISKERDAFSYCYQSCGNVLSQSENPSLPWTFPTVPTMQAESMTSITAPSNHSAPRVRELADVLKKILQSPNQVCTPPSEQFPFLSDIGDLTSLLGCYGGHFSSLADSQKQLEEYVHDFVPDSQLTGSSDIVDKGRRQEVMKLAPDAILARSATGMGWSHTQTLPATASNCRTKESGGSMDIGPVISKQSLQRNSSSKESICHTSDEIEDLLSGDSGTFSAFESLEVDSSSPRRVEIDAANAFLEANMVDTTSELLNDDGVHANAENVIPALSMYGSQFFSQNCAAGGGIRDEPSSVYSSDSVLTPESTAPMELYPASDEIGELPKRTIHKCYPRRTEIDSEIPAGVSQGLALLQGTVLGRPCQDAFMQTVVDQNMAMLQGFPAIPQAAEAPIDSSSPLATSTSLFSVPPALGLLNAAALVGGGGAAAPSHRDNMKELAYRVAAFQPINWSKIEGIRRPKRRNVKISKDPQSIAARRRREKISDRLRILQRLVPGGTRMDTASMLDEAINYVKFLKVQVQALHRLESWSNGMYSNHHLFDRNSSNNFESHDFPLNVATEVLQSRPLTSRQLPFEAASQHDFPSFFGPDQYLHQQPCH